MDGVEAVPHELRTFELPRLKLQVKANPAVTKYSADSNRPVDKTYFFTVVSSVLPDFFETVLKAIKERWEEAEPQSEKVLITMEMKQLISDNVPFAGASRIKEHT